MKALIFFICFLSISSPGVTQPSPAKVWIDAITNRNHRDLLVVINENPSREWPVIEPESMIAGMPTERQSEFRLRIALAKQVITASRTIFTQPIGSISALNEEAKQAAAVAKKFDAQGGYVNKLLSNIIYRGSMLHLSAWLLRNPHDFDAILSILDSLQLPENSLRELLQMYQKHDKKMSNVKVALGAFAPEGNFFQQLASMGIPREVMLGLFTNSAVATDHLINLDILELGARLYATKAQANSLREACEYVRRGGKLELAELSDFSKYKSLMADRIYKRNPGGRSIKPDYGEGIINLVKIQEHGSAAQIQYLKATFD